MAESMYPVLHNGQRVAVNTGFYLLPGVVLSSTPEEVGVIILGHGQRLVARFDVYAIPEESDRLKDAIMTQTDNLNRCANEIVTRGVV